MPVDFLRLSLRNSLCTVFSVTCLKVKFLQVQRGSKVCLLHTKSVRTKAFVLRVFIVLLKNEQNAFAMIFVSVVVVECMLNRFGVSFCLLG